jgi:hypothetical protein
MVKIEIEEKAAEALNDLRAQAQLLGVPFDEFLRELAGNGTPATASDEIPLDQFDRWLDELSEGTDGLPDLPPDFSRADIYNDHD